MICKKILIYLKRHKAKQTFANLPIFGCIYESLFRLYTSWAKLASPTRYLHNEFSGYFLDLKGKGISLQVFRLESYKVHFQTFDNLKTWLSYLKKMTKSRPFFLKTLNPKKIEPKNPIIDFA